MCLIRRGGTETKWYTFNMSEIEKQMARMKIICVCVCVSVCACVHLFLSHASMLHTFGIVYIYSIAVVIEKRSSSVPVLLNMH